MKFIYQIKKKEIYRIASLNSVSVFVKIALGFVSSKIIAVYVGPAGMALVGNLRNFFTSLEAVATLGFQNGIIKYISKADQEKSKLNSTLSTIAIALFFSSIITGLLSFLFCNQLSTSLFGNYSFAHVFSAIAIALPFYIASLFFIAVLNGLSRFRKVIWVSIFSNLLALVISSYLIIEYRTFGALLSVVIAPAATFFIPFIYVRHIIDFRNVFNFKSFDSELLKNLGEFSLMAIVSSIFAPLVFIALRNQITDGAGAEHAGYWEAMMRFSSYYFLFISTILTVYFLPKLSRAKAGIQTKVILYNYYKKLMPIFVAGLVGVYFLRDFLVQLVFSKEFLPVSNLFFYQILGDFFKAMALILGYIFFARKLTVAFIIFEIFSVLVLYFSSTYFISIFMEKGAVIGHAVTYSIYFFALLIYFRKEIL